jgi:hypothetical protein
LDLVAAAREPIKKCTHPVPVIVIALEDEMTFGVREFAERAVDIESDLFTRLEEAKFQAARGFGCKRGNRIATQASIRVGHDTIPVNLRNSTKAFTLTTRADRIVERKQTGCGILKLAPTRIADSTLAVDHGLLGDITTPPNGQLPFSPTKGERNRLDQPDPLTVPFAVDRRRFLGDLFERETINKEPPRRLLRGLGARVRIEEIDHLPLRVQQTRVAVANQRIPNLGRPSLAAPDG